MTSASLYAVIEIFTLTGQERAQRPDYRVTSGSQQSARLRKGDADEPNQQYSACQRSRRSSGPMQPAVWVESNLDRAESLSSRRQVASPSPSSIDRPDAPVKSEEFDRARSPREKNSGTAPIRESLQSRRQADRRDSSADASRYQHQSAIATDTLKAPSRQSTSKGDLRSQADSGKLQSTFACAKPIDVLQTTDSLHSGH